MIPLIDTHAHLDEITDLPPVIAAARAAGVNAIIAVGTDLESSRKTLQIAEKYRGLVHPALGLHPAHIREAEIALTLDFIRANIAGAVAVGEIGLDYHKRVRAVAGKAAQQAVLAQLLDIAREYDKPAIIHSRYAWRDALTAVAGAGVKRAVFHWYTGTSSVLRDIISQGYYLSATPAAEYHEEHRRAVRETPLERLLLETDAPVVYGRGRDAEFESRPADVVRSLQAAARLKDTADFRLAKITAANAARLFRL